MATIGAALVLDHLKPEYDTENLSSVLSLVTSTGGLTLLRLYVRLMLRSTVRAHRHALDQRQCRRHAQIGGGIGRSGCHTDLRRLDGGTFETGDPHRSRSPPF
jgi:hypothetical protein